MSKLREQMYEDMRLNGLAQKTQASYILAVKVLSIHYSRSPDKLSEEEVRKFFLYLIDVKKLSKSSIKNYHYGIKFFYEKTLNRKWHIFNIIRSRKKEQIPVVLNFKEVKEIFSFIKSPTNRMAIILIYSCGLRLAECINIKVADVDGERKQLRVLGKGDKFRYVPLPDSTLVLLRQFWRIVRDSNWLFPSSNSNSSKPIYRRTLQRAFKDALKKSTILKKATFHTLRNSYATHLLENGVNLMVIQKILGHKTVRSTLKYTHLTKKNIFVFNTAVNKMMSELQL
jgi:integrase/recombinase XerD